MENCRHAGCPLPKKYMRFLASRMKGVCFRNQSPKRGKRTAASAGVDSPHAKRFYAANVPKNF
jgi:hypothetical protein